MNESVEDDESPRGMDGGNLHCCTMVVEEEGHGTMVVDDVVAAVAAWGRTSYEYSQRTDGVGRNELLAWVN